MAFILVKMVNISIFISTIKINNMIENWKQFNESTEIDYIFDGAVWYDKLDDVYMVMDVTGDKVYGHCDDFDFERDSKEEALKQLKSWGFEYLGVD